MFIAVSKLASVMGVFGQVPQTGLFSSVSGEFPLNELGSELILETHQLDKSWLNEDALFNITLILVTLLTSQEPISWLKELAA